MEGTGITETPSGMTIEVTLSNAKVQQEEEKRELKAAKKRRQAEKRCAAASGRQNFDRIRAHLLIPQRSDCLWVMSREMTKSQRSPKWG